MSAIRWPFHKTASGMPNAPGPAVVPISRTKPVVGVVAIVACSYAVSWMFTPGQGTGPTELFGPGRSRRHPVQVGTWVGSSLGIWILGFGI
jgi:hypothetical protein